MNPITQVGFGNSEFKIAVYFEHRPPIERYLAQTELTPLTKGELDFILANTSNNWRKIFNCFAKLCFALDPNHCKTWQQLRDTQLLSESQNFALLFSTPDFAQTDTIHIISGRTYAAKLDFPFELTWLSPQFAINQQYKLIVAPYFDYRQLSNERLDTLVKLIKGF